ncbi:MAG: hypothetical protein IKU13_10575, partial [Clostridia bacterium]|nr:hypothetical protein [Clostridia bacterium]
MKKKFVSLLLVASFMLSMMPVYAVDLSSTKLTEVSAEYGLTAEDNMRFFKKGDWMLSVAYENGSTIYVAANKDGTVYQKVVDNLPVTRIDVSNILEIFDTLFALGKEYDVFNININTVESRNNYHYEEKMDDMLRYREGSGYDNYELCTKTYQGKTFTVKETKDIMWVVSSDNIELEFETGLTIIAAITLWSLHVPTVVYEESWENLERILLFGGAVGGYILSNIVVKTCYGSAVSIREVYTPGVNYHIGTTSKSNEYTFFYTPSRTIVEGENPSMTFTHTIYQHGEGYFNNLDSQII